MRRDERDRQREAEIIRGQEVSARNQRRWQIDQWIAQGVVHIHEYDGHGAGFHTVVAYKVAGEVVVVIETEDLCSELVVAKLALAIAALKPEEKAVPSTERDHSYRETFIAPSMRERYGNDF
jgi:hypothetical protein